MKDIWRAALVVLVTAVIVLTYRTGRSEMRSPEKRNALTPFRLEAVQGPGWSLDEQRGSVVLLNFWATWCPPCRRETPTLVELARTYGPRGLRVAGISMDDNPAAVVPPFVGRYHVPYPMLVPDTGFRLAGTVEALPTTLLLDRRARVARTYTGELVAQDVAEDVERLLAEQP